MKLYTYFRSSAAYRVRIALDLKRQKYDAVPVNLLNGEQRGSEYIALDPQGLVPALADEAGLHVQSLAIIEYLDERYPEPPLLPEAPAERARVRALALAIACDIHPLNNLRVMQYLENTLEVGKDQRTAWYRHWIRDGFTALEKMLDDPRTGRFCHGDAVTLADIALIPQVANAVRFECDLAPYPRIRRINDTCLELDPFRAASPANQPDAGEVKRS
jgi:maleylacetoacetate isomerase